MTRWDWFSFAAIFVLWILATIFIYIFNNHVLASRADRIDLLRTGVEQGNVVTLMVPPKIASAALEYAGRESGWDEAECPGCTFADWYNSHPERTVTKYSVLYEDYQVPHPYKKFMDDTNKEQVQQQPQPQPFNLLNAFKKKQPLPKST